jgi:hypothetical protein
MVITTNGQNGWATRAGYREIPWRKKHNNSREMWWNPSFGILSLAVLQENLARQAGVFLNQGFLAFFMPWTLLTAW